MFDGNASASIGRIARDLGVEPAALMAVAEIESGGRAFARVDGRPMPLIRWEGHYFHRLLPENLRRQAVQARLASPRAGAIPNPAGQQARYALLERAKAIHEVAALSSCSWGVGQVMGSHWRSLGYGSVQQMVSVAVSGLAGQVELMARFIRRNGLTDSLRRRDWAAFARAYNGPGYRVNRYDERMASAYIRHLRGSPPPDGFLAPMLTDYAPSLDELGPGDEETYFMRAGANGPAVRELQEALGKAGFFVYVDGNYGEATKEAVKAFQRKKGLKADGHIGEKTRAKLMRAQVERAAPWWASETTTSEPTPVKNWWETEDQPQQREWWDM